ncbi:MAG: hypothetical protein WKF90_15040 [Pyrinomonadaceae bacterium]
MKKYTSEPEILALAREFENGTISRDKWNHAEHLTVGFYFIKNSSSLPEATDRMRGGILNLLKSFGVDLLKEMPYHETLTCFWMQAIDSFTRSNVNTSIVEVCNELVLELGKDLPLKFYSRELLFSEKVRAEFVEPDLQNFCQEAF